ADATTVDDPPPMIIEPGLPPGRKIRLEGIDTAGWLTRVDQLRLTPTVTEFRTLGEKTCVSCKPNVWGCRLLTWIKFGSGCETSRLPWSLVQLAKKVSLLDAT